MTLWFVTPAHRRYALSTICFEQRRRVIATLAQRGISAQQVVISDDGNLEIARAAGFEVLEQDNRWLGRRFNDGIEFALRNGATWIVPIGSDDWVDPDYFVPLPTSARCSRWYAAVERDRLLQLDFPIPGPGRMIPASKISARPANERLRRGVDRSILDSIHDLQWERRDLHALQYVGFRGERHITTYSKLKAAHVGHEILDPWELLARHYPADLVQRARAAMEAVRRPLAVGRIDAWSVRDRLLSLWDRRFR